MNNRTDVVGLNIQDRFRQTVSTYRNIAECVTSFFLAFIMANSYIFADIAPFGVAFTAAVKDKRSIFAGFGAVLGYIFSANSVESMKYIGATVLVLSIKWFINSTALARSSINLSPLIATLSLAVTSLSVTIFSGLLMYDLIVSISELFITMGSVYFFSKSLTAFELGLQNMDKNDVTCLIISFGIFVMSLSNVTIFNLSIGRILAVIIIMTAALYGGEAAGSIAGISAGLCISLVGGPYSYLMAAYSFGGLIAGMFSSVGRVGVAAAFIIINAVGSSLLGITYGDYNTLYEVFMASVIFMIIPSRLLGAMKLSRLRAVTSVSDDLVKQLIKRKLHTTSQALGDISLTTQKVSQKLETMNTNDISSVHEKVAGKVCRKCSLKTRCWQSSYNDTMNALNDSIALLKKNGVLMKSEFPKYFSEKCTRLDDFTATLNYEYNEYLKKQGTQRKVSQVRSVVTDQFEGMSMLMKSLSNEISEITAQDRKLSAKVREYFLNKGVDCSSSACYLDTLERMTAEVYISTFKLARLDMNSVVLDLSDICDREFDAPQIVSIDKETVLTFSEKATLTASYGAAQISSTGGLLCGDCYDYFNDNRGKAYLVLSDGMGTGGNAAVDSAMTTGLVTRLIKAGVGFDTALKMVNSALLVKSGEESISTIDIASVDLYTGRADFYKAGAAPTFMVKGGKVGYLESASLPAGILQGVSFEKSSITFHEGDIILMVSDGVTATGIDWIPSAVSEAKGKTPDELCQIIVETARERAIEGRTDDISAVAMSLSR